MAKPHGKVRRVPEHHQKAMVEEYLAGSTAEEAAAKFGYCRNACERALRIRGILTHKQQMQERRKKQIESGVLECRRCKETKPLNEMVGGRKGPLGADALCVTCWNKRLEQAKSPGIKKCCECQKDLPVEEFFVTKQGALWAKCKSCTRAYQQRCRVANGAEPIPEGATRICKACQRCLPLHLFYKHGNGGRWWRCRECIRVRARERYKARLASGDLRTDWWKKYKHNGACNYDELFQQQGGVCAICGKGPGKRSLHIDHDHATGKIRGLLCGSCNHGLGNFRDNPKSLRKAIAYLKRNRLEQKALFGKDGGL